MDIVYGGELDELKKKYEGYTKYGLLDEIRKLEAVLRGKDNEIADLKARIQYLKQFEPPLKSEPTCKG